MRMHDYSWGASSSKKRPLPPTSNSAPAKRPKQNPFIEESSSDDGGDSFDKHTAVAPERSAKRTMSETYPQGGVHSDASAPTSMQGFESNRATESQSSASTTLAPEFGKTLNKNRLKALMAKKQGGSATPKPTSGSQSLTKSVKPVLQQRPQYPTQAGTVRPDVQSFAPRDTNANSQGGIPRHTAQGKLPGQRENNMQGRHRQIQNFESSRGSNNRTHMQGAPVPALGMTSMDTVRPQIATKNSSLRSLLDTPKTAHRDVVETPDDVGSEWRRTQAERASTSKLVKDSHRPEVGARYGHTLKARKHSVQDKQRPISDRALVTSGANAMELTASRGHSAYPTVPPGPKGKETQSNGSIATLPFNASSSAKRTSTSNLRQSNCDTRQGTTKHSVYQGSLPLNLSSRIEPAQGAPVQPTISTASDQVANDTRLRPLGMPSTKSNVSSPKDDFTAMETVTSTLGKPALNQDPVPESSMDHVRYDTTHARGNQAGESHQVIDRVKQRDNYSKGRSNQQATTQGLKPRSNNSSSRGPPTIVDDLNPQESLQKVPAASSTVPKEFTDVNEHREATHAVETVDTPVNEPIARAFDAHDSSVTSNDADVQSRIPVAVMVRLENSDGHCPRRESAGREISPAASAMGTETYGTGQDETVPVTTGGLMSIPKRQAAETDKILATTTSSVLDRAHEFRIPEASQRIDPGSSRSDSLMLNQGAQSPGRSTLEDDIPEHVSVVQSKFTETAPTESVNDFVKPAPRTFSATEATQPTSSTAGGRISADTECALTQSPSTKVLPPVPTDTSLSQFDTVLTGPNTAEYAVREHRLPKAALQTATSSSVAELKLLPPVISPTAQPYFEYSIRQSISTSSSSTTLTELSAFPLTTVDSANAQTDKFFHSTKQQYELLGMQCKSATSKILGTGLLTHEATIVSIEDISKTLTLKLWIERAEVSVCANHTPPSTSSSPLISKTLYALRLWRLIDSATAPSFSSSTSSEDEDDNEGAHQNRKERIRTYHPLPNICTELHTTLSSANRAAKRVQISLSHEPTPKSLQAQWQLENLRALNEKLADLRSEVKKEGQNDAGPSLFEYAEGRRRGCWRSIFAGVGLGAADFELIVTSVGVSGPRNI